MDLDVALQGGGATLGGNGVLKRLPTSALKEVARSIGLSGYSGLKKAALIAEIKKGRSSKLYKGKAKPKAKSTKKGTRRGKTLTELRAEAKKLGMTKYGGLKKDQLKRAVAKHKREPDYMTKAYWAERKKTAKPTKRKLSQAQKDLKAFKKKFKGYGLTAKELNGLFKRGKTKKQLSDIKRAITSTARALGKEEGAAALKKRIDAINDALKIQLQRKRGKAKTRRKTARTKARERADRRLYSSKKYTKRDGSEGTRRTRKRKIWKKAAQDTFFSKMAMFMNPFKKINPRRRKNAGIMGIQPLAMPLAIVGDVQQAAAKAPVVGWASFAITPIALGAVAYGLQRMAEPVISPFLDRYIGEVPVLKETLKFPYTTTGVLTGLAMGILAKNNLLNGQAAGLVAASAVSVGMALDLSLRPLAKAASEVAMEQTAQRTAQIQVAAAEMVESGLPNGNGMITGNGLTNGNGNGYGDGGAYMIGAASNSLGNYGAIHLGAINLGAIQSEYSDASPADAKACTCVMMPDEVSATKAGAQAFQRTFGKSPVNKRRVQSLMSRHAGRNGHRFGWLIKMIGFANFQKIASLPPHQRKVVISQLQQQAIASIPKLVAAQNAANSTIESASVPVQGTLNGAQGFSGVGYGAMMFAGQGY
jgi:hypothetical protein